MEISESRVKELTSGDHLIIRSIEEYDIAASGNKLLFPNGPSPHQRGKVKAHFFFDYMAIDYVASMNPSSISAFMEVFFCSGHKRKSAYVDRMVNIDGECFAREELMKPELCMSHQEIDDNARRVRVESVLAKEAGERRGAQLA